jgi:hypothetical protein
MKGLFLSTVLLGVACAGLAHANTITGSLFHVSEATSQNAIPANVPGGTPDVTFDVNSPFNFSGTSVTVSAWLASGGASNIVENTPGTLASLMDNFPVLPSVGTLVEFTGVVSVTNGQTFTVTHDDGLTLIIGGINLGFDPGPTSPSTTTHTYSGPTGNFPFQLVYGECCGGPAVLQVDLPFAAVPGPIAGAGLPGLILAAGGLLALARRRRKIA